MKSPTHPVPSGDRRIAQLLYQALNDSSINAALVSELRSWEGAGDRSRQQRIRKAAEVEASGLIEAWTTDKRESAPHAWFTYHLYHKAPDWIGPLVCDALNIPYFITEASVSTKQANGQWQMGYEQSLRAIEMAAGIFVLNPKDIPGLKALSNELPLITLKPFLDKPESFDPEKRNMERQRFATAHGIDANDYWMLAVGMMRKDVKLQSYSHLAHSLKQVERSDWQLLIVGDGPAKAQVQEYFYPFAEKVHFLGEQSSDKVLKTMSLSDIFVWPAINEAIGMVALEACATGLPVVAGSTEGIRQVIVDGYNGLLVKQDQNLEPGIASALEKLMENPALIEDMSGNARQHYAHHHSMSAARDILFNAISKYA